MKKEYEAPKAEKMEYDYTETVSASTVADANTEKGNNYHVCSCASYWDGNWGELC